MWHLSTLFCSVPALGEMRSCGSHPTRSYLGYHDALCVATFRGTSLPSLVLEDWVQKLELQCCAWTEEGDFRGSVIGRDVELCTESSYCFPMVSYGFLWFSMVALWVLMCIDGPSGHRV